MGETQLSKLTEALDYLNIDFIEHKKTRRGITYYDVELIGGEHSESTVFFIFDSEGKFDYYDAYE